MVNPWRALRSWWWKRRFMAWLRSQSVTYGQVWFILSAYVHTPTSAAQIQETLARIAANVELDRRPDENAMPVPTLEEVQAALLELEEDGLARRGAGQHWHGTQEVKVYG